MRQSSIRWQRKRWRTYCIKWKRNHTIERYYGMVPFTFYFETTCVYIRVYIHTHTHTHTLSYPLCVSSFSSLPLSLLIYVTSWLFKCLRALGSDTPNFQCLLPGSRTGGKKGSEETSHFTSFRLNVTMFSIVIKKKRIKK